MKKLVSAAILTLTLALAPLVTAPAAQAKVVAPAITAPAHKDDCNTTSWTWPFCEIGRPSIPRFNMGGPRPPLTPKDSVWCEEILISVGSGGAWYRLYTTKHEIRFWPDYYTHTFRSAVWNGSGYEWTREPLYLSVDCDA